MMSTESEHSISLSAPILTASGTFGSSLRNLAVALVAATGICAAGQASAADAETGARTISAQRVAVATATASVRIQRPVTVSFGPHAVTPADRLTQTNRQQVPQLCGAAQTADAKTAPARCADMIVTDLY